jgi:hypothetical protein
MKKRRVTLNLDVDVVEGLEALEGRSLSAVANDALREFAALAAHRRAMGTWLDELDETFGPPSAEAVARAEALLDELGVLARRQAGAA